MFKYVEQRRMLPLLLACSLFSGNFKSIMVTAVRDGHWQPGVSMPITSQQEFRLCHRNVSILRFALSPLAAAHIDVACRNPLSCMPLVTHDRTIDGQNNTWRLLMHIQLLSMRLPGLAIFSEASTSFDYQQRLCRLPAASGSGR